MDNVNLSHKNYHTIIIRQQLIADLNLVLSEVDALVRATADQRAAKVAKVRSKAADSVAAIKTRMAGAGLLIGRLIGRR